VEFANVIDGDRFDLANRFFGGRLMKRTALGEDQLGHPVVCSNAGVVLLLLDVGDDALPHLFKFFRREGRLAQLFGQRRNYHRQVAAKRQAADREGKCVRREADAGARRFQFFGDFELAAAARAFAEHARRDAGERVFARRAEIFAGAHRTGY
jgi:hypothetical protein